jgi:nucleotide-binding universal stress UspA family protein
MASVQVGARFTIRNVLYLTDFSEPSEAALPYAVSIAREYGSKVFALHILIPEVYTYTTPDLTVASVTVQEEAAQTEIGRLESELSGLAHECIMERGTGVWPSLERAIEEYNIDLIVLGTHGRTGAQKLLMGSVAEEVFRRSRIPVLTVGPGAHGAVHNSARFRRVLFATDFTQESLAAAPCALSFAQENQAHLILLHVMKEPEAEVTERSRQDAVSNASFQLNELVPAAAALWCRPETVVQAGNPAEAILRTAKERDADLIVLGLRDAHGHLGAATHLERTTAHKVVAHATCPVLTVRG